MKHPNHNKAQFKYNGGRGALICSGCRVILKTGESFTEDEIAAIKGHQYMPAKYCKKCQLVQVLNENDVEWTESIRAIDEVKYKVITFAPPFPTDLLDIIYQPEIKTLGFLSPSGEQGIDVCFPM